MFYFDGVIEEEVYSNDVLPGDRVSVVLCQAEYLILNCSSCDLLRWVEGILCFSSVFVLFCVASHSKSLAIPVVATTEVSSLIYLKCKTSGGATCNSIQICFLCKSFGICHLFRTFIGEPGFLDLTFKFCYVFPSKPLPSCPNKLRSRAD